MLNVGGQNWQILLKGTRRKTSAIVTDEPVRFRAGKIGRCSDRCFSTDMEGVSDSAASCQYLVQRFSAVSDGDRPAALVVDCHLRIDAETVINRRTDVADAHRL